MAFPFKLPPDSKPIIRKLGWHPALCISVMLLGLLLIAIVLLKSGIMEGF